MSDPSVTLSPASYSQLPAGFRQTLDLDERATAAEALAKAELRLKETLAQQGALKPKHPSQPRLRKDRERFEPMVMALRELAWGKNVDDLCDLAEEALGAQPPNKTIVRDLLRRARSEGKPLAPDSVYLLRVQKLEDKLAGECATPAAMSPPEPAVIAIPPPPKNSFHQLEGLIDQSIACLDQEPPDYPGANEYYTQAERESVGKTVPNHLKGRLLLFKRALDQVKKDIIRGQVDGILNHVRTVLAHEPPRLSEARVQLQLATVLLQESPGHYFQRDVESFERVIQEHEKRLARLKDETSPAALPPASTPPEVGESAAVVLPPRKSKKRRVLIAIVLLLALFNGLAFVRHRMLLPSPLPQTDPGSNQIVSSPPIPATPESSPKTAAPATRPDVPLEMGEVTVSVSPEAAELFTNGISIGNPPYPVTVKGVSRQEILLEGRLEGYSNATRSVVLPGPGEVLNATLELIPKPAFFIVRSEPPASEVTLRNERGQSEIVKMFPEGIALNFGMPVEVSVAVPDYEPVTAKVPALKPDERHEIDFGKLKLQTGGLRLKADPPDARFSLVFPGRPPLPQSSGAIEGLPPRVVFQVVAEREGYFSESNAFLLLPHELRAYDFGRLKPLTATLRVSAAPQPFDLTVAWDGATKDFGASGQASGLPAGKNLLITVSATNAASVSTNLVLARGESRELQFGRLESTRGFLLLKSEPGGAEVSYGVDGHVYVSAGVTDRLNDLPLGCSLAVTLHKDGYADKKLNHKLKQSGETLDFGHLLPLKGSLVVSGPNEDADIYVDGHWSGVKSGGILSNLTIGQPYTVRLHKPGRKDVFQVVILDGSKPEQKILFPEMLTTDNPSPAEINSVLRDINADIVMVRNNLPLTDASRRAWNEWIGKVEILYQSNAEMWNHIQGVLNQLHVLVNTSAPVPKNPQ